MGRVSEATRRQIIKDMVRLADICSCIKRLHPDLQQRVSPDTLRTYKEALDPFLMYLQNRFDVALEEPEDVDLLLLEFRTEFELTRSKHTLLVAALEFFMPHLKGKMILSREALRGRTNVDHIKHTIPIPSEAAHLIAAWHTSEGRYRMGAAVLVQHSTGLRPSELLGIQSDHVFVPIGLVGAAKVSIRLGSVVSTKVKREQSVLVCFSEYPFVCKLLEWLVNSTTPGGKIFGFGYSTYNNSFKLAEQHFRLQVGWTAHSGRAGFATDLIVKGVPFSAVQARGRWLSENSFRCYIDVIGSLDTKARVSARGLWEEAVWCQQHIDQYFAPVLAHVPSQKTNRLSGSHASSRLEAQRKPIPFTSGSRPSERLGEEEVARSRTGKTFGNSSDWFKACSNSQFDYRAASADPKPLNRKGKGRGRLLPKAAKGSIFD